MKVGHGVKLPKEYNHGVFCRCGATIYLKDNELTPPETVIKCPKCGFVTRYFHGTY